MGPIKETREIISFQSLRNSRVESKYMKEKKNRFSVVKYIRFDNSSVAAMASAVVIILIGVIVAGIINIVVGKLWSNFGERWVAGKWVNRTMDRDAIPGVIIYLPEKKMRMAVVMVAIRGGQRTR